MGSVHKVLFGVGWVFDFGDNHHFLFCFLQDFRIREQVVLLVLPKNTLLGVLILFYINLLGVPHKSNF
jgi:hypothetical protein